MYWLKSRPPRPCWGMTVVETSKDQVATRTTRITPAVTRAGSGTLRRPACMVPFVLRTSGSRKGRGPLREGRCLSPPLSSVLLRGSRLRRELPKTPCPLNPLLAPRRRLGDAESSFPSFQLQKRDGCSRWGRERQAD